MIITTEPYQHQIEALQQAWSKTGFAYFLEMGTGKSKIIVDEIVNLIELNLIKCAVIVAPNNVHINWESELIKHGPPNYDKWTIQIWRSGIALEKKEAETIRILESDKVLVFLMNIEALSSVGGKNYLKRILLAPKLRGGIYMAVDESHKIKNQGAQRTKAIIELSNYVKFRRIATGTEAEEGIEGLYSQFKFLDQNIIGLRSYTAFKNMYCIEDQKQIRSGQIFRQIVGYRNEEMLASKIAPFAYQKRKKDCLDLPDKVYVTHEISMTKEQERIYSKLQEQLLYELKTGELVDATMAITNMIRLQQVLCGHINTSDDPRATEIIPSNRANFVSELVEDASGKVIIFCRFIMDVQLIVSELASNHIRGIGVSSRDDGSNRLLNIDKWRQEKDYKALVITVASGGTGLTLNEASTTIFYSNTWSSTDRIQAEDRNHRIGQESKVTYHDIIVPKTIDHRLLAELKKKQVKSQWFRSLTEIQKFMTDPI
jgi:SNF2 family DNA or RNA helicase